MVKSETVMFTGIVARREISVLKGAKKEVRTPTAAEGMHSRVTVII